MRRWEKRLSDVAQLLRQCAATYFEPDRFRLNCNQFLTTSRTVNFLIQKDKALIPDFNAWYAAHVIELWAGDKVMAWGRDSRNHIEKVGDLDLESELAVTLIFTHDEDQDISILCGRHELIGATVRHLLRYAEKNLPTGVSDSSVLRIRRRWVANTLPGRELLGALTYIYGRQRALAVSLASYLGHSLPCEIPEVNDIREVREQERQVRYVKFRDRKPSRMANHVVRRMPDYSPPQWLQELAGERDPSKGLPGLNAQLEFHAKMAEGTFQQFGNHVPMMWMYDEAGQPVDYGGMIPDDQATKFIYWRTVADRVESLRPATLIWVSEIWIRDLARRFELPMRKMPIKGEALHVVGIDRSGVVNTIYWDIQRDLASARPRLVRREPSPETQYGAPYFLLSVKRAFARMHQTKAC
ncbi:MAG: hypothetical protein JSS17_04345 [Proteobacteria bacterium]|nr:hypothetical protein [Pseudomonadota bacterium]